MTTSAILLREIETMPKEAAVEVLDFALFIKGKYLPLKTADTYTIGDIKTSPISKHISAQPHNTIAIKDAYGIFKDLKGMDTTIERDEEDRI